jgi:hypothetical protein
MSTSAGTQPNPVQLATNRPTTPRSRPTPSRMYSTWPGVVLAKHSPIPCITQPTGLGPLRWITSPVAANVNATSETPNHETDARRSSRPAARATRAAGG